MLRNLEEIRLDLILHILEAFISEIEEKVIPNFQNEIKGPDNDSNTKVDLRSDRTQQNPNREVSRKTQVDFPKLNSANSNQKNHPRVSSTGSQEIEDGYEIRFFKKGIGVLIIVDKTF